MNYDDKQIKHNMCAKKNILESLEFGDLGQ